MITNGIFEKELLEVLMHLSAPEYDYPESLRATIGCTTHDGDGAIREVILRAIESLRPSADTPATSYLWQIYGLLHNRFVLKLTQEETAERLCVSRRTIARLQQKAVFILAGKLQEDARVQGRAWRVEESKPVGEVAAATQESDWETQMQREVDSLQNKTPGAFANVNEVVARLLEIANALTATLGIRLRVVAVQSELIAAVHPVLLLQVLVSILKRLAPYVVNGELALFAKLEDGKAKITLSGTSFANRLNAVEEITQRISLVKDITVELLRDELQVIVWISMPAVGTMTVLVVDDNEDMVRFYRDCTIGTRYNIVHINQGEQLLDGARTLGPDVIVLDIMLPDSDGWHLLMHLHKDQKLRAIPIIISTVVREEELALSLGASYYLAKPVRPRQFIQALDLVCRPAAKEAVITLTN